MSSSIKDYYQILQVDASAEHEVIEAAYRRLARKYHPDADPSLDATRRMQAINEAHMVLRDPAARAEYDRQRRHQLEPKPTEKAAAEKSEPASQAAPRTPSGPWQNAQAEACYHRGMTYLENGDLDRAIAEWSNALSIRPDYAEVYLSRGQAYYNKYALDQAIADYDRAIQLKADCAEAYYQRGNAYRDKGDLDRAMLEWDKAIELQPDYAEAYYTRANVYFDQGSLERALADYGQTIQLKPDYVKAYNGRGITYQHRGDLDRAIAEWSKAIELKPDYAEAYFNRGLAYYYRRDLDRARVDLRTVLEVSNDPRLRRKAKSALVRTKSHHAHAPKPAGPPAPMPLVPDDVKAAVWQRDGGRCVKCGSQHSLAFDYIIPVAKGGSITPRNLQLLCEKCHQEKSGLFDS